MLTGRKRKKNVQKKIRKIKYSRGGATAIRGCAETKQRGRNGPEEGERRIVGLKGVQAGSDRFKG